MSQVFNFLLVAFLCAISVKTAAQQTLLITEVVADNEGLFFDAEGDTPDWIELYNNSQTDINLKSYSISDSNNSWDFPEITLSASSYLLVIASAKDTNFDQEFHTNFKLDKDGEGLQIRNANNEVVESVQFPALSANTSYGRITGDLQNWKIYSEPTPGQENEGVGVGSNLYRISSSHKSGYYPDKLSVDLMDIQANHEVYFTLDGSFPTDKSTKFDPSQKISIEEIGLLDLAFISTGYEWEAPDADIPRATVLRAAAYAGDIRVSEVLNQSFWIAQEPHTLPIVSLVGEEADFFDDDKGIYVKGNDENFFKDGAEWERPIHASFFDNSGDIILSQKAGIRVAGANTRLKPQKTIRLYARSSYGNKTFDYPFWGEDYGGEIKRISLRTMNIGSWSKAGFQDDIIHEIINGEVDAEYVRRNFAVVYLNGVYWGIHSMREHNNQHFIQRKYDVPSDDVVVAKAIFDKPDTTSFDRLVDDIAGLDLNDARDFEEVSSRLDIKQYADYIITNLAFANQDWPFNNVEYWYSDEYDGKVRFIINDLDATMLLHNEERLELFIGNQAERLGREQWGRVLIFLQKLLEVPEYRSYFNARLNTLLRTSFAPDRTIGFLRQMASEIEGEMETHISRWHFPKNMKVWDSAVDRMESFLIRRPLYLMERSNALFGFPIHVYPNPVKEQMYLELEAWTEGKLHVDISDLSGRIVLQRSFDLDEGLQKVDINMYGLPAGVFVLTARYQGFQVNQQVIKVGG